MKVVIIGQDPYHGPGQAEGLCFSVKEGVKMPPSLVNIFREVQDDTGSPLPPNGSLRRWAEQGVMTAQKFDEVTAQRDAALATERAAKAQYDMAVTVAKEKEY